jgi:plasmid stabilization system protein ParE
MAITSIRQLYDAARSLKYFPNRGRNGQNPGTRELIMAPMPYIIVYGIETDTVHIFRVIHTSRKRS